MTPATKKLIEELADIPRGKDMTMTRKPRKRQTRKMRPGDKRLKGHYQTPETRRKIAQTLSKNKKANGMNMLIRQYRDAGQTVQQIAFALDLTISAVKSRLYRMDYGA